MKTIKIEDATNKQLLDFCAVILGLEVKQGMSNAQLIAKIDRAAPGTTEIQVVEEGALAPTPAPEQFVGRPVPEQKTTGGGGKVPLSSHHADPKIEVMIPSSREPGGDRDVEVSVNGFPWQIKRDVWVPVPYRVYEALENARETTYELVQSEYPGAPPKKVPRDNYSYPFNTRNAPSQETLDAWRARKAAAPDRAAA